MSTPDRRYCRVYWAAIDDPKFVRVWDDDGALACWLRLLVYADMAWPASASLYHGIRKVSLAILTDAGLVDPQSGNRYRIHGLDAERSARSESARNAAAMRWHSAGNAETMQSHPIGNAETMPSRAEQSRADIPPTPAKRGNGSPRSNGTNPRAVVASETAERRDREHRIQMAYLRGDITGEERAAHRAAGTEPLPGRTA